MPHNTPPLGRAADEAPHSSGREHLCEARTKLLFLQERFARSCIVLHTGEALVVICVPRDGVQESEPLRLKDRVWVRAIPSPFSSSLYCKLLSCAI